MRATSIRKRYRMSPALEKQLLGISARQIDRRLKAKKSERRRRIYGRTQPGSLLKHHIPVSRAPAASRRALHPCGTRGAHLGCSLRCWRRFACSLPSGAMPNLRRPSRGSGGSRSIRFRKLPPRGPRGWIRSLVHRKPKTSLRLRTHQAHEIREHHDRRDFRRRTRSRWSWCDARGLRV